MNRTDLLLTRIHIIVEVAPRMRCGGHRHTGDHVLNVIAVINCRERYRIVPSRGTSSFECRFKAARRLRVLVQTYENKCQAENKSIYDNTMDAAETVPQLT